MDRPPSGVAATLSSRARVKLDTQMDTRDTRAENIARIHHQPETTRARVRAESKLLKSTRITRILCSPVGPSCEIFIFFQRKQFLCERFPL